MGVYGAGMHDHVLRALEVGERVALAEDDERVGFGPLFDAIVWRDGGRGSSVADETSSEDDPP